MVVVCRCSDFAAVVATNRWPGTRKRDQVFVEKGKTRLEYVFVVEIGLKFTEFVRVWFSVSLVFCRNCVVKFWKAINNQQSFVVTHVVLDSSKSVAGHPQRLGRQPVKQSPGDSQCPQIKSHKFPPQSGQPMQPCVVAEECAGNRWSDPDHDLALP